MIIFVIVVAVCCALLMQIIDGADVNLDEFDPASDEYLLDETDGIYLVIHIVYTCLCIVTSHWVTKPLGMQASLFGACPKPG